MRGGGRGQGAGARYRVRGRCVVEGVDKGRERAIGCADGAWWRAGTKGGSVISGARTVRGGAGIDKGWERDIGCADGAGWRAGTSGGSAISGARRAGTRGGSAISGARTVRGGGRGQGAGARYRVRGRADGARSAISGARTVRSGGRGQGRERGRCAVGGERDIGCTDGARWRAGTRGGSAISGSRTVRGARRAWTRAGARYEARGRCAVEGVDKGRERDIGCADGARWRAWTRGGSALSGARTVHGGGRAGTRGGSAISGARTVRGRGHGNPADFHSASIFFRLGFRVPGLTLFFWPRLFTTATGVPAPLAYVN